MFVTWQIVNLVAGFHLCVKMCSFTDAFLAPKIASSKYTSEDYILFRKNSCLEITKTAELKNVALLVTKKYEPQLGKNMS